MENTTKETLKKHEPKKKIIWVFDKATSIIKVSDDSIKADMEKRFSFKLERYKDAETHEESLKIVSFKDGKDNGFIVTSISTLDTDIKQLKRFGVVLENTYYRDLYKKIEMNYLYILELEVYLDENDSKFSDLIEQVKLYVSGDKDLTTKDFCYVPVNMFNTLALDCGYSEYEFKTLRANLEKKGYIHKVSGRYAILTRIKDKPERVIAFYRTKLGVELPAKTEGKKAERSSIDEK